ncbi:MAG: hypothetical protein ACREFN_06110 [Acetobacteraceae bacterium]
MLRRADLLRNRARVFQDLESVGHAAAPSLNAFAAMDRQLAPLRKMVEAVRVSGPLEEAMRSLRRLDEVMRPVVELMERNNRLFQLLACPRLRF